MEFKHPNYYKKLRKQYRDSQVVNQVKLSSQSQASSDKQQGPRPRIRVASVKNAGPAGLNQLKMLVTANTNGPNKELPHAPMVKRI